MNKSVIVYGPSYNGMAKHAVRMRKHFGLHTVVYGFDPFKSAPANEDHLYLVTCEGPAGSGVVRCMSFAEVAKQINDAIPLTDWQSGPPPAVGEWNASNSRTENARRWWNGNRWSSLYWSHNSQHQKDKWAGEPDSGKYEIEWRGLAEEPIVVAV